jgi:hypothetical protein
MEAAAEIYDNRENFFLRFIDIIFFSLVFCETLLLISFISLEYSSLLIIPAPSIASAHNCHFEYCFLPLLNYNL